MLMKKRINYDQRDFIREMIKLSSSQHLYQDVTLICKNGIFMSNSFILASIFSTFKEILKIRIDADEAVVISIPDIDKNDFESFFQSLEEAEEELPWSWKFSELNTNMDLSNMVVKVEAKMENDKDKAEDKNNHSENLHCESIENEDIVIGGLNEDFNEHEEANKCEDSPKKAQTISFMKRGKDEKKFKCLLCNLNFANHERKQDHMKLQHPKNDEGQIECTFCGKMFKDKKLSMHVLRNHTGKENYVNCSNCKQKFHKDNLEAHEKSCATKEAEVCPVCGKSFLSLKSHMQLHEKTKSAMISCQLCGKELSKDGLRSHMRTHETKTPCPECGVIVRNLDQHYRTMHTSDRDKPFPCQDCDRGFLLKGQLEKHRMSVHLKTRPYKCRYGCSNAYNDVSNRNTHEKKTHGGIFKVVTENTNK